MNYVDSFIDLVNAPFAAEVNAVCWQRKLAGDFVEIINRIELSGNITEVSVEELIELKLSDAGQQARKIILNDWKLLEDYGAQPVLNIIKQYDRDDADTVYATDVYSFHVDRSPITTDTFLCTYFGAPSEIIPNALCEQIILVPEIVQELRKLYTGNGDGFEYFLREHFFDLHYRARPGAQPINLGTGNLWRLAVDHPDSNVLPCVHRAPAENGQLRLLMIC